MKRAAGRYVLWATLLLANAAGAAAQDVPVSRLLPEMVKLSATVDRGATGDHRNHFVLGLPTSTIAEFNKGVLFETVAFPIGPAATVVSAQRGGQEERLFGAGYVDTAFTLGAKRWLFSLSYQSMTVASIDDLDLRSGQLAVYVPHAPVTGDVTDRDMMQQLVAFRVNRKTTTLSLGRGWGDRFDMRLVVPLVHMAADARIDSRIIRTASPQTDAVHRVDVLDGARQTYPRYCTAPQDDTELLECHGRSTAFGFGDIWLGGKIGLLQGSHALSFAVDARLPTGNAEELIGLGAAQVKPALLWSLDAGRFGTRFRADYTLSNGELTDRFADDFASLDRSIPDEIGVGLGIDADIAPRTTLAVDVLARRLQQVRGFSAGRQVFPSRGPGSLPSAPFVADDALLVDDTRDLTQIAATIGLQFDVRGGFIAQMSALVPVSGGGLRQQATAVFSLTKRY